MKPLPKIDLRKLYSGSGRADYDYTVSKLIKKIEEEDAPHVFRNQLFALLQLYFDGILEESQSPSEEREVLGSLFKAGKEFVGAYYRGEPDLDLMKEILLPPASKIILYSDKKVAKDRHLAFAERDVQSFGLDLPKILKKTGSLDVIAPVASGGFEPVLLALDILEMDCRSLVPTRYSRRSNDNKAKVHRKRLASKIKDKNVLVVEDWVVTGTSLAEVMVHLIISKPKEIHGAAVFSMYPNILSSNLELLHRDLYLYKYKE